MIKPSKIEAFVQALKETSASKKWGFNKLAQREDILNFFDELEKQNLFIPAENPAPERANNNGYYIPFWEALPYLERAAEVAAANYNGAIILKIKSALSAATAYSQEHDERGVTNFHTWHSFTKILASLPASEITAADIRLIEYWIDCSFDTSLVIGEITQALLPTIIKAERNHAQSLLKELIPILIGTKHVEGKDSALGFYWGSERPYVETYWLNDFFKAHAGILGSEYGEVVIPPLIEKLEAVLTDAVNHYSYLRRPAIEEHEQNHHIDVFESILITALRDALAALVEKAPAAAEPYVSALLESKHTILNRVGWHIVSVGFSHYKKLFMDRLPIGLFKTDVWHEMYVLLEANFGNLTDCEKDNVFEAIQNIWVPEEKNEEERRRYKEHVERDWLSAIHGRGSEKVDARFSELVSKRELGGLREHPEFISYHETLSGEPPAPITAEDILEMRHDKSTLIGTFNDFEPKSGWREPTYRSFADVLSLAVQKEPTFFLEDVDIFLKLKLPYQYGLIDGLKNVKLAQVISGWERALDLCHKLVEDSTFWEETDAKEASFDRPNREWALNAICDLVDGGVKTDETAFDQTLLPRAKEIIFTILNRTKPDADINIEDAMSYAINTTRGRCLGVLFNYALRTARVADKETGAHEKAWNDVQPIFDQELAKCSDGNFEFSTQCGAYLPNLMYLSKKWLSINLDKIFPDDHPKNFSCALQGFSYAGNYYKELYNLVKHKALLPALRGDTLEDDVRERFIQLAVISYLRGNEDLDDEAGVLGCLINSFRKDDLRKIAWFLYHLRDPSMDVKQIKKVMTFWKTCSSKINGREEEFGIVLSDLSELIVYASGDNEEEIRLLQQAAPYVEKNFNAMTFIKGLSRIVQNHPSLAGGLLLTLAKSRAHMYPKEEVINILDVLAKKETELYRQVCNELLDSAWVLEHFQKHKDN